VGRYFTFAASRHAYTELQQRVREILERQKVLECLPPAREVAVRIEAPIRPDASLREAHGHWPDPDTVRTPAGLPRQPGDALCPPHIARVSIECVKRRGGGMGSYHGFQGYYASVLLSLADGSVWDARGEPAD